MVTSRHLHKLWYIISVPHALLYSCKICFMLSRQSFVVLHELRGLIHRFNCGDTLLALHSTCVGDVPIHALAPELFSNLKN